MASRGNGNGSDADPDDGTAEGGPTAAETQIEKHVVRDSREYLNLQNEAINRIESDARAIIRLNLLVFGLLLTAGSVFFAGDAPVGRQLSRLRPFLNEATYAGFVAVVGSVLSAFSATVTSKKTGGLSVDAIDDIRNSEYTEDEFLEKLVIGYRDWIDRNLRTNRRNAMFLRVSNIFLILELSYFVLAFYWGIHPPATAELAHVIILVIASLALLIALFSR